ncbi:MAG: transcriptional regulator [Bdellovibrio sp. ArHS]|uniref:Crp/Fnr family transcriptional regulator n=1 Tax=Bdellovibrio sp. ArHS TaxID=1569284 RepID=UPI000582880E|nr:Crp/Fnr family transcriptional regulator [Bdellovibrio sp. ArHS]KHD89473.1 MAG: transcriptional regulator [Bdellovibrio sp. ArHS]
MTEPKIPNCPICSSQEEKVISELLTVMKKKKFIKNALIFEAGEDINGLFLITKGSVKISKLSPAGKEIVLQILSEGKTFGEGSILGQEKHSDTFVANENTEVLFLPKKEFQAIIQSNTSLYQAVVGSLIKWMNNLDVVIENINTPSAKDRVLIHLGRLQEQQKTPVIKLDGKKHDVALMLGLRPETFSRALAELEEEGRIKMNHKQIQLL